MNLTQYALRLADSISKDAMLEELNLNLSFLEAIYAQGGEWDNALSILPRKEKVIKAQQVMNKLTKAKSGSNLAASVLMAKEETLANFKLLEQAIEREFKSTFIPTSGTTLQLGVLLVLEQTTLYTRMSIRLIVETFRVLVGHNGGRYVEDKKRTKYFHNNHEAYAACLETLHQKVGDFNKGLNSPPNASTPVATDNAISKFMPSVRNALIDKEPSNFNGSPILWIRRAFMGMFEESYTELEDQKRYLELLLIEAEGKKEGNNSPAIRNEIERIEERLAALQYKMDKIVAED